MCIALSKSYLDAVKQVGDIKVTPALSLFANRLVASKDRYRVTLTDFSVGLLSDDTVIQLADVAILDNLRACIFKIIDTCMTHVEEFSDEQLIVIIESLDIDLHELKRQLSETGNYQNLGSEIFSSIKASLEERINSEDWIEDLAEIPVTDKRTDLTIVMDFLTHLNASVLSSRLDREDPVSLRRLLCEVLESAITLLQFILTIENQKQFYIENIIHKELSLKVDKPVGTDGGNVTIEPAVLAAIKIGSPKEAYLPFLTNTNLNTPTYLLMAYR